MQSSLYPAISVINYIENFQFVHGVTPLSGDLILPAVVALLYLVTIYAIYKYMQPREKLALNLFGSVHNFNMLAISVACFFGLSYGALRVFVKHNFNLEVLVCDSRLLEKDNTGPLYFWLYVFAISKFYELLDTVVLAFRKGRITFLHVYHHAITAFLCFWCMYWDLPNQWVGTSLNAFVHIPMYAYYLGSMLEWKNMWWKIYITQSQILQFVLGLTIHSSAFIMNYMFSMNCRSFERWYVNAFGILVYFSYLLLFVQFYNSTYKEKHKET